MTSLYEVISSQGGSRLELPPLTAAAAANPVQRGDAKFLTLFSTGHGFSKGGTGAALLDQVSETGLPTGAADFARITSDTAGTWGYVRKTGLTAVDMTKSSIGIYVRVPDLSLLSVLGVYYAPAGGLAGGNYVSFNQAIWNQYQPAGGENLQSNVWTWITIPYENRALTGSVTDPGGANPPTAITDWQIAFNAKSGQACEIHLGGLAILPNLI